jgi:AAA domain
MAIGECKLIAIEGTNGTGKTTVSHALTARLKRDFSCGAYCDESARQNPFVEDFTLYNKPLSIHIELHLVAKTIADQVLGTRHNAVLVCDKTPVSLIGYTKVLLANQLSEDDLRLLETMRALLLQWCRAYDLVFFLRDRFDAQQVAHDLIRAKVISVQDQVENAIEAELHQLEVPIIEVPAGLSLESRIDWMTRVITDKIDLRSD